MEDTPRNVTTKHGKRKGNISASSVRPKAVWDSRRRAIFVDLCIDEVRAGNRPTSYFTKEGWENILQRFNVATGRDYDRKQLKNHWDGMKKDWQLWGKLVGKETVLEWDNEKQTIVADYDWWEARVKAHPEVAKFRERGLSLEQRKKYDELFGCDLATGEHAWALSSGVLPKYFTRGANSSRRNSGEGAWSGTNNVDATDEDEHLEGATIPLKDIIVDIDTPTVLDHSKKQATVSRSTRGKGKHLKGAAKLEDQLDRLLKAVESRSTATSFIRGQERTSIPAVFDILANLPGVTIGDELYMLGTRLFAKQENREIFIALPNDEVKLQWLRQELQRESIANPQAWMRGAPPNVVCMFNSL